MPPYFYKKQFSEDISVLPNTFDEQNNLILFVFYKEHFLPHNGYIGEDFLRQISYAVVGIGHFEVYEHQMITHIIYYHYFFHSPFVKRKYLLR